MASNLLHWMLALFLTGLLSHLLSKVQDIYVLKTIFNSVATIILVIMVAILFIGAT